MYTKHIIYLLEVLTELVIGYIHPGRPVAIVAFKTYGYSSVTQALSLLGDFKIGHYMKIPPRSMFIVQLVGTIVSSTVYVGTAWWLLTSVKNICDPDLLLDGSPWTCPGSNVFYSASIIWGVVGPLRMFTDKGVYPEQNWWFLIGFLSPIPVWFLQRKFPEKKWIKWIHVPLILNATADMPTARTVNYWSWGFVGFVSNYIIYRRYKGWWAKHKYIFSAALDAGVAFLGVILYFALQSKGIYGPSWWGDDISLDCPLARSLVQSRAALSKIANCVQPPRAYSFA
ncbi:hypothetical protein OIU78_018020 [Salix suchowensis]|nr:hypothetical protein OIU78_018020 [Salix suchowensis]